MCTQNLHLNILFYSKPDNLHLFQGPIPLQYIRLDWLYDMQIPLKVIHTSKIAEPLNCLI